ncbi:MAG TPA: VOC family protein [Dehalococcoidia bacterium]|jgi:catechol 2,3-dioxygenase-like lactoylglutathione lyase family enzyme
MRLLGLDHVQLAMPAGHEEEARRFYVGVLGMTEVAKPAALAARGGCWFEAPGTVVHIGVEEPFAPARKAHPAFVVADLEICRRVLRDAGAPVVADDSLPDVRRLYTADPFDNRIELIQHGDGFTGRSAIAGRSA